MNDAAKAGNVAHRGHDAIRYAALQAERIADDHNALAFLRRSAIERKRADQVSRRVDLQQRQVAFGINRCDTPDLISVTRVEVDFGAIGALDDVAISDDPIDVDEKAAAPRKLFAARIEGFDGHR